MQGDNGIAQGLREVLCGLLCDELEEPGDGLEGVGGIRLVAGLFAGDVTLSTTLRTLSSCGLAPGVAAPAMV